jgi:hypothetical protein
VASLATTPAEHLLRALFHRRPGSWRHLLANSAGYEPPAPEDVAESLSKGAADSPFCRVEDDTLATVASLANAYAGTLHTVGGLLSLHAEASAAFTARWGRQPWCCAPERDLPEDETRDIGAEWAALGG